MARLDELAEGIATLLSTGKAPEPLYIDLVGESPANVAFLVRAIIDATERRGVAISRITLDPRLGAIALRSNDREGPQGVSVVADTSLLGRIAVFRFPAPPLSD